MSSVNMFHFQEACLIEKNSKSYIVALTDLIDSFCVKKYPNLSVHQQQKLAFHVYVFVKPFSISFYARCLK